MMNKTTVKHANHEFSFTDDNVVNKDDLLLEIGTTTKHSLWLLHDHGFTLGVICAINLQDALDIAADEGILDRYLINEDERSEYDEEQFSYLGNYCSPYDIEILRYVQFNLPELSLTRLIGETIEASSCYVSVY